jgi:16S rRNA (cytosine967-C5)-methyltransferase
MIDLLRCALPETPNPELATRARRPFLADHGLQALTEARRVPAFATPNMAKWFRQTRRLGSKDRRVVAEIAHGVIRHEAILLRAGARTDEALIEKWADLIDGERFDDMVSASPAENFSTALSLPLPVATEWLEVLGETSAAAFGATVSGRAPLTIRTNSIKCTRDALRARLSAEGVESEPTKASALGLHLQGRHNVGALASFKEGWFEVQDESSQLAIAALGDIDGLEVLDFCAGAGGKSLAFFAAGAKVRANDVRRKALGELTRRAERAGATVQTGAPEMSDIVFVDAPCSGLGHLWRTPALRWSYSPGAHIGAQRDILDDACEWVRPGGRLVYATCSLLAEENDHGDPGPGWTDEDSKTLWPHIHGTDGFFWQVWRRED